MDEIKLDNRAVRTPFNCFEQEEARKYVFKRCFFSNCLADFSDLSKCVHGMLYTFGEPPYVFIAVNEADHYLKYQFCLPYTLTYEEIPVSGPVTELEFHECLRVACGNESKRELEQLIRDKNVLDTKSH